MTDAQAGFRESCDNRPRSGNNSVLPYLLTSCQGSPPAREEHGELGAFAGRAVCFDDGLDEDEARSESSLRAGHVCAEHAEPDRVAVVGMYPRPVVAEAAQRSFRTSFGRKAYTSSGGASNHVRIGPKVCFRFSQ